MFLMRIILIKTFIMMRMILFKGCWILQFLHSSPDAVAPYSGFHILSDDDDVIFFSLINQRSEQNKNMIFSILAIFLINLFFVQLFDNSLWGAMDSTFDTCV